MAVAVILQAMLACSSIYNLLDDDLLPINKSTVLIGCVGPNCTGDSKSEPTLHNNEQVLQRVFDVKVSFIQPMHDILQIQDDELRLHHYSWQICRIGFDNPPPNGNCTWRSVADGHFDASLLIPAAKHILTLHRPIVLAVCNEFNSQHTYTQICGGKMFNCSHDYHDMFNHVQKIFKDQGVTSKNVVWSWNTFNMPAIDKHGKMGNATWDLWYPGDDKVSWVGVNAFTGINGDGYQSVQQLYSNFYQWVKNKNVHPFFHAFGAYEFASKPGWKKGWFEAITELVGPSGAYNKVRAAFIFSGGGYNMQTSGEAIAGAKASFNSPVFNGLGYANSSAAVCCRADPPGKCCWEYNDNSSLSELRSGTMGVLFL
jgi:hypothetical protein